MRLVKLNYNKIKIFLTMDDLLERGLTKEDIWKDSLKWQQLFDEMLDEANEELGVDIQGTVAIEIFSMQTQGMIMIVTMEEEDEEDSLDLEDTFIEMNIYENDQVILYYFDDFEEIITTCNYLRRFSIPLSSVYYFDHKYYLTLKNYREKHHPTIIAILSEFGNVSMNSDTILQEYGKTIIENDAIEKIGTYFL